MMKTLNCDEVSHLIMALKRLHSAFHHNAMYPSVSRGMKAARLACLEEIMEVCGLQFQDEKARNNALYEFLGDNMPKETSHA